MIEDISKIQKFVRAASYLTVTQIYLQDNYLLKTPLQVKDLKKRLFGHWGTCPGINFVYANLNYFVQKHKQKTIFVLGPGHGFAALQANLFLEGTLGAYYKEATRDENGIAWISKIFSWPYGASSHSNPEAPGLILEGGELGYSLATAYGAVLDNPDLLAVCMIGDGESETGPISAAWHINKLIDPTVNGTVLPIVHVNEYKISGPTNFGRMSDKELRDLFNGYGYEPFFVKGNDTIYEQMLETLEKCYQQIQTVKKNWGKDSNSPKMPMIILQTAKGWTGIKELKGEPIEGNIVSHQVVAKNAKKDSEELNALEEWLKSYKFEELFDGTKFSDEILSLLPSDDLLIGNNPYAYSGKQYQSLHLPDLYSHAKKLNKVGNISSNSMQAAGEYLKDVFELNSAEKDFRLMSPDETYSNRLDDIFKATSRSFVWPIKNSDKDLSHDGRVMEMLSEHNLHGLAQGYILTGRHAVFATYESFAEIVSSMAHQYEKFLKVARTLPWRGNMSSMNYMFSSVLWRQEHNGFTHQNPSFVSGLLDKHDCNIHIYFPADDNSMLVSLKECLESQKKMNVIVAGKTIEPRWLSIEQAEKELADGGISRWDFASDENPDIVIAGIGDYVTKEAVAAVEMVKAVAPEIKIRMVNILKISGRCEHADHREQQIVNLEEYCTEDKPVIINYHGYPEDIEAILFHSKNPSRFSVHGYKELGATTTPFDLMVRNETDRYHLAIEVLSKMKKDNVIQAAKADELMKRYREVLSQHKEYIISYGVDPIELEDWHWETQNNLMDDAIQLQVLDRAKTIAIVGFSHDSDKYSYKMGQYLQENGYKVIPVNPHLNEAMGEKVYSSISEIPKDLQVDMIALYRRSEEILPHVKEVVERGTVKSIWLPEGVRNTEAEEYAKTHGLTLVSDFCIMKVHQQLKNMVPQAS